MRALLNSRFIRAIATLTSIAGFASGAGAATLVLNPIADNTLYEDTGGALSNGAGDHLFAGQTAQGSRRRGVLAFDLSSLPANAVVQSVTLTLFMSRSVSGTETVDLHRILSSWGEAGSDAGGEEGGGAASLTGDATWIHTFFDTSDWAQAGGDYVSSASASQAIGSIGSYQWTGSGLVADVQAFIDGNASNFGWMLIGDEINSGTTKRFDSRESLNAPMLSITITPEPSSGLLLSVGLAGLAARRRSRNP